MKLRTSIPLLTLGVLICLPAANAQTRTDDQFNNPAIVKGQDTTIVVTGVLEKTDKPHEYRLVGEDGNIYNLTSDAVSMHKRVGQKVVVTGTVSKHKTRSEERKENRQVTHL